jgi:hypothetical protein
MSYTEYEFSVATEDGIPRLIFMIADSAPGPRELHVDLQHGIRQDAFRKELREAGPTISMVASPQELQLNLLHALHELDGTPDKRGSQGHSSMRPCVAG